MAKFARKLKRSLNGTDINTALNSGTTLSNYKKTMRKQHKLEQRMAKIMRYQPSVNQNYNDNYSSDLLNMANGTPDYIIKQDNDDSSEESVDDDINESKTIDVASNTIDVTSSTIDVASDTTDDTATESVQEETTVKEHEAEVSTINKDNNNFKSAPSLPAINNNVVVDQSTMLNDQLDNSNEQIL